MKSNHRDFETSYIDRKIHITWPEKNSDITLRGSIIDGYGRTIENIPIVTRTAKDSSEIEVLQQQILTDLTSSIQKYYSISSRTTMDDALQEVLSSDLLSDIWAPSTIKQRVSYFKKNVLPYIKGCTYDNAFTEDKLEALTVILAKKSEQHKNFKRRNIDARLIALNHLANSQVLYDFMYSLHPELPEIILSKQRIKIPKSVQEPIKHLPFLVMQAFEKNIFKLAEKSPIYARAIALFYFCGLRSAEAAAINSNDINDTGEFSFISVSYQEIEGKRFPLLKTENAYRLIPLSDSCTEIIRICAKNIATPESQEDAPLKSSELSKIVKNMLIDSGLSEAYFTLAEKELFESSGLDSNFSPSIEAYILRRNRNSINTFYLGLSSAEQKALLGHSSKAGIDTRDYNSVKKIHNKIRYFNASSYDQEYSITDTIVLEKAMDINFNTHPSYSIRNASNTQLKLQFLIEPCEPGDTIILSSPINILPAQHNFRCEKRKNIEKIGSPKKGD